MTDLKVKKFTNRMLGANTFVLYEGNKALIIDPCSKPDVIYEFCRKNTLFPKLILLTHAHIDHILFVDEYKKEFGIKAAIHYEDHAAMTDPILNGSGLFGIRKSFNKADIMLNNGDTVDLGKKKIKILSTPGHTPGSISIYTENVVFSGDTLFYLSVGRTDLGRGNQNELLHSVNNILFKLPEDTIVYPGHGTFTTIKYEKEHNPYII